MDIRGPQGREDGVRVLDALGGVGPVADVDTRVKDQVGGAALKTRLTPVTFVILPAKTRSNIFLVIMG